MSIDHNGKWGWHLTFLCTILTGWRKITDSISILFNNDRDDETMIEWSWPTCSKIIGLSYIMNTPMTWGNDTPSHSLHVSPWSNESHKASLWFRNTGIRHSCHSVWHYVGYHYSMSLLGCPAVVPMLPVALEGTGTAVADKCTAHSLHLLSRLLFIKNTLVSTVKMYTAYSQSYFWFNF